MAWKHKHKGNSEQMLQLHRNDLSHPLPSSQSPSSVSFCLLLRHEDVWMGAPNFFHVVACVCVCDTQVHVCAKHMKLEINHGSF